MTDIQPGDAIRVKNNDGDGAAGLLGVVRTVYKSGRCCVELEDNSIRNLPPESLEKCE